ncbi:MAG: hydroxymethylglutaryl-CoA reductase [Bacteriovorax sp.]|jgi:hydroxymethylglutaryl-CoA reductase
MMSEQQPMYGFSKLSKFEKIDLIVKNYFSDSDNAKSQFKKYWHSDSTLQKTIDEFSENTVTNFLFPMGVVPNMLINGELFCVPMVIEESSVVAASARSANFWLTRGGFHAEVISTTKVGQVHFIWNGEASKLNQFFDKIKPELIESTKALTSNMENRGGGMTSLSLVDRTQDEPGYYQLLAQFETCDAMGANFINSILEVLGKTLKDKIMTASEFSDSDRELQIVMAILSNYTPDCRVRAFVECPIEDLNDPNFGMCASEFAEKFARAIRISKIDVTRAATHNKGIFNGIDAVVVATGNDYRAVEACGHAYAARDGQYRGLSDVSIKDGMFRMSLELPLSIGTVGGLTSLHPLARLSLDLLGRPAAPDLMKIVACIGLAQNFAAVRSLVTSGIQKGHMKMHLMNILNHLEADANESAAAKHYFENEIISFKAVREFVSDLRNYE